MTCEKCGTANAPGATFCIGCGQNLPVASQPPQPPPPPPGGAGAAPPGAAPPPAAPPPAAPPPGWNQQPPPPPPPGQPWGQGQPAPPPPPGWGQQPPPPPGWGQPGQQWGPGQAPPPGWGQPVAPSGYYPPGYGPGGYGVQVKNNMTLAIIATVAGLFCGCLGVVPGIVGIVFAGQVNTKLQQGDVDGANRSARLARVWAIVGFVLIGVSVILWTLLIAVGNRGNGA